jgi:ATP-binding cassette subfamily C protein RsaD
MAANDKLKPTPLNDAIRAMRPAIATAVVFSMFVNVLGLTSPLYMLQVYDRVLASRNETTLLLLTIGVIFLLLVSAALESLRTQVLVRGGLKFDALVRDKVFDGVLVSTLRRQGAGPQSFRDMDTVRESFTGSSMIAFCDLPWLPIYVLVSFILHWFFGVLAVVSVVIMLILAIMNDRMTEAPLKAANTAAISAQNDVTSSLRNSEVIKAMGMWMGLQKRWITRRDAQVALQAVASDRGGVVLSAIKFFRQVVQTFILGGGAFLAIEGQISAGTMIVASMIVGKALAPVESAVGQWKALVAARGSWDRLQEMFRATPLTQDAMELPVPTGKLSVEGVVIVPPGASQPSVRGIAFQLEPGTVLGIVGPSASGKSSLSRALVGVWTPAQGVVRLDGFDLKQWNVHQLGSHIGYLPQDIELFSGTVAENIARFVAFEPNEVIAAAQMAGVHEMIQGLPNGYDTQIGDGGAALSGGQRQRIALARAVFRVPALIVLDEPNASLDADGEAALAQAIARLKEAKRTIIFVTHKPSLLNCADKIMIVMQGMIAQLGERDAVLAQLMGVAASAGRTAA